MTAGAVDAFLTARLDGYIAETARLCLQDFLNAGRHIARILEGFAGL